MPETGDGKTAPPELPKGNGTDAVVVVPKVAKEAPHPDTYEQKWRWWDGERGKDRIQKLEQVFLMGGTDKMACLFAGITPGQLYYYTSHHNRDFEVRKQMLKENPTMMALKSVFKNLPDSPEMAFRFLERRMPEEFGPKVTVQGGGDADTIKKTLDTLAMLTGQHATIEHQPRQSPPDDADPVQDGEQAAGDTPATQADVQRDHVEGSPPK